MQAPTDNLQAAKLEAILDALMTAETDEELEQARRHAVEIARLREEDLTPTGHDGHDGDEAEAVTPPVGTMLQHLRGGAAWRYEAPRVPGGYKVGHHAGGQWIQVQALAEFYAGLFDDMAEAGSPPEDEQVEDALADLEPYGWTLEEGDDGWEAVSLKDEGGRMKDEEEEEEDEEYLDPDSDSSFILPPSSFPYKRVKKGTPGAIERTDKRGRSYWVDKLPEPKATSEEARKRREDRGPVDREKLQERLSGFKDKHKVLRSNERVARASIGLLHRHHGEQALHRVEELADAAERAYNAIPEGKGSEGLRNRLGKKLAILHRMAELAGTKLESMRKKKGAGEDVSKDDKSDESSLKEPSIDYGDFRRFVGRVKDDARRQDLVTNLEAMTSAADARVEARIQELESLHASGKGTVEGWGELQGLEHIRWKRQQSGAWHPETGQAEKSTEPTVEPTEEPETKPESPAPKLLSTVDVAKIANVAPRTVMKWVDNGILPGTRDPETGNRFVSETDMAAFMEKYKDVFSPTPTGKPGKSKESTKSSAGVTLPVAHEQLPKNPMKLRDHIADALTQSTVDEWAGDLAEFPVPTLTAKRVLQEATSEGRLKESFAKAAADGYLTNGRFVLLMPEKLREKLKGSIPTDIPPNVPSLKKNMDDMLSAPASGQPLRVIAAQQRGDWTVHLLEDDQGNRAMVNAAFLDFMSREYPGATFHLQDRAKKGKFDGSYPVTVKSGDKVVGIVMPLAAEKESRAAVIRPPGVPPRHDRIMAGLEVNAKTPPEAIQVGKDTTKNGKKQFRVVNPGVASLDVTRDNNGDWDVVEYSIGSGKTKFYGLGMSRQRARQLATDLLVRAHDTKNGAIQFKAKDGQSAEPQDDDAVPQSVQGKPSAGEQLHKLADRARESGDPHSELIYRQQAREVSKKEMSGLGEPGSGSMEEINKRLDTRGKILQRLAGSAEAVGTANRSAILDERDRLIGENKKDLAAIDRLERETKQPKTEERGFTGTDAQGREWRDGVLVPAEEKAGEKEDWEMPLEDWLGIVPAVQRAKELLAASNIDQHPNLEAEARKVIDDHIKTHADLVRAMEEDGKDIPPEVWKSHGLDTDPLERKRNRNKEQAEQLVRSLQQTPYDDLLDNLRHGDGTLEELDATHAEIERRQKTGKGIPTEHPDYNKFNPPPKDLLKKKPHEMTLGELDEFRRYYNNKYDSPHDHEEVAREHRKAVEDALAAGKTVPPEVLKDYPDLQSKALPSVGNASTMPDMKDSSAPPTIPAPTPPGGTPKAEPIPGASPRQQASADTKATLTSSEYEFARSSAIPNAGEDVQKSARHVRNQWQGLDAAEKAGTAKDMVTRDNLLRNEPPTFMADITPTTAMGTLVAHLAMSAFPADPDKFRGESRHTPEVRRKEFYEAYQNIKRVAEKSAREELDPFKVLASIHAAARGEVKRLRGQSGSTVIDEFRSPDRYNPVANALLDLMNRTAVYPTSRHYRKNDVGARLLDFAGRVKQAYGEPSREMLDRVSEHVKDVIEGESFNKTFGTVQGNVGKFDPARAYVAHATRKGGPVIDASTVQAGMDHLLKIHGMRGLQWGNSVTDSERQHHLQKAAEAFADLTDILKLPPAMASFSGKLALAIGARGKGTALAHYEPELKVINLTRKGGVGSLAHEWGHFLDHLLGGGDFYGSKTPNYLTHQFDFVRPVKAKPGERANAAGTKLDENGKVVYEDVSKTPLFQAVQELRNQMHKSGYERRVANATREAVSGGTMSKSMHEYWNSVEERFARAFECFVKHKLEKEGRENTYLAGLVETDTGSFWPTNEEVKAMAPAFEVLLERAAKHFEDLESKRQSPSPTQHSRSSHAIQYARLAERARAMGDLHSARIYARQARGEF